MRKWSAAAVGAMAMAMVAGCPMNQPAPDDGDLTLSPGFNSRTRSGMTTTGDDTTNCDGVFPSQPSFVMTVTSPITGMRVRAASDEADVTLRIVFGGSSFCADEQGVVERGSWSAGDYDVYVGTAAAASDVTYEVTITEP